MPLTKKDGSKGLLATGKFGDACKKLEEYNVDGITDTRLLTALFRDYTFVASAYLLEPCDIFFRAKGEYGLGRAKLPRNIAVPLSKIAAKIGARPFMEYAQSYSLYNYTRIDPNKGIALENLELIRGFSGMKSEKGFILVHVAMVVHSGNQVKHTVQALQSVKKDDRFQFEVEMRGLVATLQVINRVMDTMWTESLPSDYNKFRTFIMGTKNQPMFPHGVVYEGVDDAESYYRGESGANDSIIPSADNFLELTGNMPDNPLTEILRDFRTYRPANHNEWLAWLENEARVLSVRKYAMKTGESALLYLTLLDQVREFRDRHWKFTKEYILRNSEHPVATGGSPITTWLPNQLDAVLSAMVDAGNVVQSLGVSGADKELLNELKSRGESQRKILKREVDELRERFKQ